MARRPGSGTMRSTGSGGSIKVEFRPSVERIAQAYRDLGAGLAEKAISRAQNETGNLMRTRVARSIAKVTRVKYGAVRRRMRSVPSRGGSLEYKIVMRSAALSLLHPDVPPARQTRVGVVSGAWGGNTYHKAFIAVMPNGHRAVFWRSREAAGGGGGSVTRGGRSKTLKLGNGTARTRKAHRKGRLPIREVFGPHLPNEMVDEKKTTAPLAATEYDRYFGTRFEKHYTHFFRQIKAKHGL